jgi:uncharacterized protein (DUF111 family)
MAELETALRKTSDEATKKFDEAYDRLMPPIVADGHVAQYREKKLIEGFKRLEVPTQTNINLSDCREKTRIREVVYDLTDGFGVKRRPRKRYRAERRLNRIRRRIGAHPNVAE